MNSWIAPKDARPRNHPRRPGCTAFGPRRGARGPGRSAFDVPAAVAIGVFAIRPSRHALQQLGE